MKIPALQTGAFGGLFELRVLLKMPSAKWGTNEWRRWKLKLGSDLVFSMGCIRETLSEGCILAKSKILKAGRC